MMKKMRLALILVALATISAESMAMSLSDIRHEARFLTDRMGHELGLSNRQYNDVYEINFDFLYQVNEVIDDVVFGYDDAVDYYYYLLDVRNEDLMYVLRNGQYRKFVKRDYFYRPIYMVGRTWGMRIWNRYTDRDYFYFSIPAIYHTYSGAHYRIHFAHSFYADRYQHALFHGAFRLWGVGHSHHHYDGWVTIGKKKHTVVGSRPWSNAKNYEQSRRDLKKGYVSVPSRDKTKRVVKVDSEENRRTAVTSSTSSGNASRSGSTAAPRSSSASTSVSRSSSSSASTSRSSASGSSVSRSSNSSNAAVSRSSGNSSSASSKKSGTSVSSGSSRSSASGSSVSRSSGSSGSSRSSVSGSSGGSTSRSSSASTSRSSRTR